MSEHDEQTESQAEPQNAEGELAADCIKAVEDYRGENISKWEAVSQISAALRSATVSTDNEQRSSAGSTYLAMLDEHDRSLVDAGTRGSRRIEQRTDENDEPEGYSDEEVGSKHTRLSRSGSPSSKRHKFTEGLYAWKIQEEISPTTLSPNLERTRRMVQNYTADLKHAYWSLQSAGSLPPFPKSEWKHVLSGTAVNLDAVFSGLFSTLADDKTTTSVGDFDLSVSGSKPSKIVQTHGDWTIAWTSTSAAILCAFPHRAFELQQYSEYILQFFGALPYSHTKVINLDKAIRRYTGEVKHIELSEVGRFRHLEARYLQEDGAGNRSNIRKEKEGSKPNRRSNEVCRQWNNGICNRKVSECRYRHLCAICRGNHPSTECPKKD
jgi:hypothetical protein